MSGPDLSTDDVLQRAAAALRSAHDGRREGSGFTRARILATVEKRRRSRLRRWLVLAPLGSALLVGSAWAQSTGSWPRVWQAVASVLPFVEKPEPEEPLERRHRAPTAPVPRESEPLPVGSPAASEPEPPTASEPEPAPSLAPPPRLDPPPAARSSAEPPRTSRARRSAPPVAPSPAPAPAPQAPDPELQRFRAAHERHVQGQPRAAIAAYEEYLQAYPSGRFVPEARYNSALDWIKLGEHGAARRFLQPFADGAYGGYRQSEAQRLLEALDGNGSR